MRFSLLGTTQALRDDGTAVPVGGARLRALLTVLALRPGRTVPVAALVDEVWGAEPPADAQGALQALVGRLRRVLGAGAVASDEGGYRLAAVADDIDLFRFERLTADGVRGLADGNPAKAAELLDQALGLWRGPALADLPDRVGEAARWDTRHLDARRTRLAAWLALDRADEALPELTALCDAHPLDEALQVLRLRALRDAGRTAEALAAYDAIRRALADRLGADPGAELRSLHADLLDAGQALPTGPAPARAEPRTPGNLRARLTSFVGRGTDIDAIRTELTRARLLTLLGPGGAGKTRLSQEAAEGLAETTAPDGVWLAELAPVSDPAAVPEAVVSALGARETVLRGAGAEELRVAGERQGDDPLVRLVEHCADRRMILVLDNCEHVIEAAAALAEHLLARCPGLTVLATSREPLGVPGEILHPVEPLPQPYALRLFGERGATVRPGFRVDESEETSAAVTEICRRLDGLPLAIELAAARLRMLTPRQIADRLDDRFRLLTSGARTALPRQQTLRAVVDWSWDLLDHTERAVLARLSVFSGGCDLTAAETVCGPEAPDVLSTLSSLVDKSLVVAAPDDSGEMRYRLLETVAEYAGDRLDEAADRTAAERAHLTYYRELARTTDPLLRGAGQRAAIARIERDYENLRTALRRAAGARDEQEMLSLTLSLLWFWMMRDLRTDARIWTMEAAALGPDPFGPDARPAPPVHQRCTDVPPPLTGDLLDEARREVHLTRLGYMDMELEVWQGEEGRARLRTIVDTLAPDLPQACRPPGHLWYFAVLMSGQGERMAELSDRTVRACRDLGYEWELAHMLQMRANLLANRVETAERGLADAEESLDLFTRLGDEWGKAEALSVRGEAHERLGRFDAAAADFVRAQRVAEDLGAHAQIAILSVRLGNVLIEQGEGERGEQMLRDTLDPARKYHNEAWPAARMFLLTRLATTGRTAEARQLLDQLREEFKVAEVLFFRAVLTGLEAMLDVLEGSADLALVKAREALDVADDPLATMLEPHMAALHLLTAANALTLRAADGDAATAARLIGASDASLPSGHVRAVMERDWRERAERTARASLGDERYARENAEGGGLSVEEATALLRREPTDRLAD
ncbi:MULTISPECIES: BTAD domain-containing putative transcriptional regulator [unclassified Streptomyces]|uniref:BTAD domain-containing putative transcriptional regulator n=1 Tax=unclassified Streptomyces TaxID=2593676 RepID=UPI000DBA2489|nr:BTAD domain-containing putative transcriptional regulator [Streptomyces sp. PsTaAH-137]MYT70753.1 AfsR family transcriptional regulator [Streptomyces sp. SID8367]RAJ90458.1 putative ATPase [Streptomyces sp. PsTaAH-137]